MKENKVKLSIPPKFAKAGDTRPREDGAVFIYTESGWVHG